MFTDLIAPFGGFDDVFDSFNELIKSSRLSYSEPVPPVNVYTTSNDKMCTIDMALAGYTKDELNVSILGKTIVVEATPKKEEKTEGTFVKQRIHKMPFKRAYEVPSKYDMDKAEVSYENGILSITIPTFEKKPIPRKSLEIK